MIFCLEVDAGDGRIFVAERQIAFVFLDGRPFSRRYQIDSVLNTATRLQQSWAFSNACAARKW